MNRIAIALAALVATITLSSCSAGDELATVDVDDRAPDSQVTSITAEVIRDHLREVREMEPRLWFLVGVEVADGAVKASLPAEQSDFATQACMAVENAVRASKLVEMPVTITSIDTGLPLALSSPESRFEKNCRPTS